MANLTAQQTYLDELPATGEVDYDAVRNALLSKGESDAVREFHALRRAKKIVVRIENDGENVKLFVSRPA